MPFATAECLLPVRRRILCYENIEMHMNRKKGMEEEREERGDRCGERRRKKKKGKDG